jgi:hypothetical protein
MGGLEMNLEHCYVNIPRSRRNWPVYRIISQKRLLEMFSERANTLVNPVLWDDPFENFIREFKGRLPSGEIVEFAQRYDFYGQCWTLLGGTDAMWRIYSSDKQSVRIKVRLKTLVESLAIRAKGIVLCGRVRYLDAAGLLKWAKRVLHDSRDPDVRLLGRTLLVKRAAFAHENEVRILYLGGDTQGSLFRYRLDPHAFIEELTVDPRLSAEQAATLVNEIRMKTGFRGPISHSNLYAPPRELVLRLGPAYASLPRTSHKRFAFKDQMVTRVTQRDDLLVLPIRDLRFSRPVQRRDYRYEAIE